MSSFVIPTRQETDVLFESETPLGGSAFLTTPVARVDGYAKVAIIAASDQPFGINVEEAVRVKPDGTGDFVQTDQTITAVLVNGQYQVADLEKPFGKFMKMVLGNLSPNAMGYLSFLVRGVPLP